MLQEVMLHALIRAERSAKRQAKRLAERQAKTECQAKTKTECQAKRQASLGQCYWLCLIVLHYTVLCFVYGLRQI